MPFGKLAGPAPQGEGMPQDYIDRRRPGRPVLKCAPLMRTACAAALAGLAICAGTAMACAGDDDTVSSSTSFYDKFLQVIGVEGGVQHRVQRAFAAGGAADARFAAADGGRAAGRAGLAKRSRTLRGACEAKVKAKPRYRIRTMPIRTLSATASRRTQRPWREYRRAPSAAGPNGPSGSDYPEHDRTRQEELFQLRTTSSRSKNTRRSPASRRGPA